jgi:hypothetical protein
MRVRLIDLKGKTFGRLTVKGLDRDSHANSGAMWKCECVCGGKKTVSGHHLRNGSTSSCGCLRRESQTRNIMAANKAGLNRGPRAAQPGDIVLAVGKQRFVLSPSEAHQLKKRLDEVLSD